MVTQLINDDERGKRAEAIAYAKASVELEGFVVSQELEEEAQRFINGEIDLEEFVSGYGKALTPSPE